MSQLTNRKITSEIESTFKRERERERESKLVPRLVIVNILLVLTIAFLIKVLFDLANSLENPPRSTGNFHISEPNK